MTHALIIAITPTERDWLLRIIRYSPDHIAGREPANAMLELLESAMTAREARAALMEIGEPPE